ncbi:hypothetical protein BUALT_Bualt13G0057500 [Buddleja alternifolia]|uniref:Bidirectional sugar transporter SWEET n=1 Tax=Buddleja alternifolia TaxID=168488 RepID=A0AAV6WRT3_9LAMI|nr:hypothetical protein BUALT_Bualt13G0057500 [Buddleja alternifolia]
MIMIFHIQKLMNNLHVAGNLVSFMVYIAPLPTFYRIYKKKSTEGFQSVPYVVALLSSLLWIYYATLKSNEILLITINSFGCLIEAIYIVIFISYAPKKARMLAVKLLLLLNFCGFGFIVIFIHFWVKEPKRVQVLGWISVALSATVYIAPLSIMVPNIAGFIFGVLQILLYAIYKNCKAEEEEEKLPAHYVVKPIIIASTNYEIHPVCSLPIQDDNTHVEIITLEDENACAIVEPKEKNDGSLKLIMHV